MKLMDEEYMWDKGMECEVGLGVKTVASWFNVTKSCCAWWYLYKLYLHWPQLHTWIGQDYMNSSVLWGIQLQSVFQYSW